MRDEGSNGIFAWKEPNFLFCFRIRICSFLLSDHGNPDIGKTVYFHAPSGFDKVSSCSKLMGVELCLVLTIFDLNHKLPESIGSYH